MKSWILATGALAAALALPLGMARGAEADMAKQEGAALVDAYGYKGCVELTNADARVVLCPQAGGRVLEYSWKGVDSLAHDPKLDGWIYNPEKKEDIDPMGGRFDIGPEMAIPRHPDLWFGAWKAEITGPRSARMTSVEDKPTGVQLVRDFVLDPATSKLTVTQTMKNVSEVMRPWYYWSRTTTAGFGIVVMPLSPYSRFPAKYVRYDRGGLNTRPRDPNVVVQDNFLVVKGVPDRPKLGMDPYVGWFAYLEPNNLLFVKRFPVFPDRMYADLAGITICIYYSKEGFVELEPMGPRELLEPGKSASFTEDWWILPFAFPASGESVNIPEVEKAVNEQAK